MRLVHKDNNNVIADMFLKRRSLYVLRYPCHRVVSYIQYTIIIQLLFFRGIGRREFTHEVLGKENSYFNKTFIPRERRVSVICRSLPNPDDITD